MKWQENSDVHLEKRVKNFAVKDWKKGEKLNKTIINNHILPNYSNLDNVPNATQRPRIDLNKRFLP